MHVFDIDAVEICILRKTLRIRAYRDILLLLLAAREGQNL